MIADTQTNEKYDVIILGGGLAGLTLARQLLMQNPDMRLAVVEKQKFPVDETTHKVGESTVEIGAHYFGEQLGLKKHLTDHQLPKFGLRFFFKDAYQSLDEATEVGGSSFFAAPSYQVDRGRLENYLAEADEELGATIFSGSRVREVEIDSSQNETRQTMHRVTFFDGEQRHTIQSRWLVDASGRAAFIKRKLNLEDELGHDINAAWFRIDAEIQIDSWSDNQQWKQQIGKVPRRWLSTNHLMGEGYWVWLIPLATGSTSIGIVADPRIHPLNSFNRIERSFDWLHQFEPECAEALEPYRDKVQDFLAMKKLSRGSRQVYSVDRWALVGEAAAFLDPFYSPGSDFIAIGNTMTAKLIEEDLAGKPIAQLAPTLQSVFLTLFQNNLQTYRNQYPLFGNPRIMAIKFVWDYAVYWGFPALLYFNEKLTDISFIQSISSGIEEIRDMNLKMQEFFIEWYKADPNVNALPAFVDQSNIEIMTRLNRELTDRLEDSDLQTRFRANVLLIRHLMEEITQRVRSSHTDIETEIETATAEVEFLTPVFEMLNV